MRILVTGAAGFIGSHLIREMNSDSIVGLDDLSTGLRSNIVGSDIEFAEGSILDKDTIESAMRGCDAVVHLAALPSVPRSLADPARTHEVNATGTMRVLEAARTLGVGHVIVASSSSVYGANPTLPKSEHLPTAPLSPYAASKLAEESYALAWQHSFGMKVLALRLFNVFGERQQPNHAYAAVIPAFAYAAVREKPVVIHGDGLQSRDFTYVGSVCAVISAALKGGTSAPGPVNLAYGSRTTLLGLLDTIESITGKPVERTHTAPRAGDVRDSQADATKLQALFPSLHPVPLEAGLRRTVNWMREHVDAATSGLARHSAEFGTAPGLTQRTGSSCDKDR